MAAACAVLGAAIGVVLAESPAPGPSRQLVNCADSAIYWQDAPPQFSFRPEVQLPGGGRLTCGYLVEPGGSAPVAVVVQTGSVALSAATPAVAVVTVDDLTDGSDNLSSMSFRPGQEYLVTLDTNPNQADMFVYSKHATPIALHLVFSHP